MKGSNALANAVARSNQTPQQLGSGQGKQGLPLGEDTAKSAEAAKKLEAERAQLLDGLKLKKASDAAAPTEKTEISSAMAKISAALSSGPVTREKIDTASAEIKKLDARISEIQSEVAKREQQRARILDSLKAKKAADAATQAEKTEISSAAAKIFASLSSGFATPEALDTADAEIKVVDARISEIQSEVAKREQQRGQVLDSLKAKKAADAATQAEKTEISSLAAKISASLSSGFATREALDTASAEIQKLDVRIGEIQAEVTKREQQRVQILDSLKTKTSPPNATEPERLNVEAARAKLSQDLSAAATPENLAAAQQGVTQLDVLISAAQKGVDQRKLRCEGIKKTLEPIKNSVQALNNPDVVVPSRIKPLLDHVTEIDDLLVAGLRDAAELDKIKQKGPALQQEYQILTKEIEQEKTQASKARMEAKQKWKNEPKRVQDLVPPFYFSKLSQKVQNQLQGFLGQLFSKKDGEALIAAVDKAQTSGVVAAHVETFITSRQTDRETRWQDKVYEAFAMEKGKGADAVTAGSLTTTLFWKFVGGWTIPGNQYVFYKQVKSAGPRRVEIHVTVSGDSLPDLTQVATSDPMLFEKPPQEIFQALFITKMGRTSRVHATSGDHYPGGDKIYLGDDRADDAYGGDAKVMNGYLADFRTFAVRKIMDAKAAGWKLK